MFIFDIMKYYFENIHINTYDVPIVYMLKI